MNALISLVAGFAFGIFTRSLLFASGWPILFVLLLAALIGAANVLRPRRAYALGVLFFIFCALGMLRAMTADTPPSKTFMGDLRHRVAYDGIVAGDPDVREKNQRIPLVIEKEGERVGALAVMPLATRVAVGDRVRVYGSLFVPMAFETDNGRTFRYDKYLQAKGERFLIEFGSITAIAPAPWYSASAALARIKHALLDGLGAALPQPDAALAGGIVIGGKVGLSAELQDAFTRSGLVQIIVLSGYNVMIVAEWVMAFLAALRLPRRLQYVAGGAALLLFVGIAGITSTAVRAAIMAIIALYARASGKTYAASRALLVAVFLMLAWNPLTLCFDPGFDLSVAATAGVIWLSPIIEKALRVKYASLKNAIATTLAAQTSVLPLLLYMSGLLSFVALPANLLVNAVVPLAMAGAAVAGVIGMLFGAVAPLPVQIIGLPTLALTRYIIFIATKSAALPYAALTLERFPFVFVVIAYAALIAFAKRFSTTDQFTFSKNAST
ncbi:ComEC/Rec2 family competence protein [Patescibacteria group bacterium]|nr:ComEC/Rec2 family competence protein [Patescibacteria group bacterium]